nr:MAG TPA: NADH dehydrogenase [Caudoviricetes sp.]
MDGKSKTRKDEVIMIYPEHLNYNRFSFRNQEKEGRLCKVA